MIFLTAILSKTTLKHNLTLDWQSFSFYPHEAKWKSYGHKRFQECGPPDTFIQIIPLYLNNIYKFPHTEPLTFVYFHRILYTVVYFLLKFQFLCCINA